LKFCKYLRHHILGALRREWNSLHKMCNNGDDALETYPPRLSQVSNLFVIGLNHRMTMLKNQSLELENLVLPEFNLVN